MTTAVVVSAILAALSWFAYRALTTFLPSNVSVPAAIALSASVVASLFIPVLYAGYMAVASALGTTILYALMARNYLRVPSGRKHAVSLGVRSVALIGLSALAYFLAMNA